MPLEGIEVREFLQGATTETLTDAEGRFRMPISLDVKDQFSPLPVISVEGRNIGVPRQVIDDLRVSAVGETDLGDIVVDRGIRFLARAVDGEGRGIPGATMRIDHIWSTRVGRGSSLGDPLYLTADPEGRFDLRLPRTAVDMTIYARGYSRGVVWCDLTSKTIIEHPPTTLTPARSVGGILLDRSGHGIAGMIMTEGDCFTADAEGRFEAHGIGQDESTLDVVAEGFVGRTVPIDEVTDDAPIILEACRHLDVRLEDATSGRRLDAAEISLCQLARDEEGQRYAIG